LLPLLLHIGAIFVVSVYHAQDSNKDGSASDDQNDIRSRCWRAGSIDERNTYVSSDLSYAIKAARSMIDTSMDTKLDLREHDCPLREAKENLHCCF
jgi:hypothetical protein